MSKDYPPQQHIPVLLDDVLQVLAPQKGESYLDLTAGYGGHASKVLEATGNYTASVLVDRDEYAISQLQHLSDQGVALVHQDFLTAAQSLADEKRRFDMLLVDLGVSSPQLDRAERGFSFKNNGPLDMRMDARQDTTAETIVNEASIDTIAQIIHDYGEEPYQRAKRYAEAIVAARPLKTTNQLAQVIADQQRGKWGKTHPATRTFQAIRIAVNDELGQIETLLPLIPKLLNQGGRVAVISFHSLEDRLIKRFFKEQVESGFEAELNILTKKAIAGSINDVHNPRSRSAKLRAAVKK